MVLDHGFLAFRRWGFIPWVARRTAVMGLSVVTLAFSRNGVGVRSERFTELEAFARLKH